MQALAPGGFRVGGLRDLRARRPVARRARRGSVVAAAVAALAAGAAPTPASAHAVVLESSPAPDAVVTGPELRIELRFNSRIDPERSRLALVAEDGSDRPLEKPELVAEGTLASRAIGLAAGAYRLHWQVLAVDGHITRGDIPFRVVSP